MNSTLNAVGSSALPALADSSSLAATAPSDLPAAMRLVSIQLKLHLLTSEHLLFSDGFLYDNPALWDLLTDDLQTVFASRRRSGATTLLVQAEATAITGSAVNADVALRGWAFGLDGKRRLEPSCFRILGVPSRADQIQDLSRSSATLEDYASKLGLSSLNATSARVRQVLNSCTVMPKQPARHAQFRDRLEKFLDLLVSAEASKASGPVASLFDCIHPIRSYLTDVSQSVSRSTLEAYDRQLWWRLAPFVNQHRLAAYYGDSGTGATTYLPSPAAQSVTQFATTSDPLRGTNDKWAIAIEQLSFSDLLEIRAQPSFRNGLEKLGSVWLTKRPDAPERYLEVLKNEWKEELVATVSKVAPHCVADKKKSDWKWITPVSQLTGCAAGLTTLAILGLAAPVAGLVGLGLTGATGLGLLGAKHVVDSFCIDKVELAAHLIAGRVISGVPK